MKTDSLSNHFPSSKKLRWYYVLAGLYVWINIAPQGILQKKLSAVAEPYNSGV
jgi:hypothetical protein